MVSFDTTVQCGAVKVQPGNVVFADDGVVVEIPQKVLEAVLDLAITKSSRERIVGEEFRNGRRVVDVLVQGVL